MSTYTPPQRFPYFEITARDDPTLLEHLISSHPNQVTDTEIRRFTPATEQLAADGRAATDGVTRRSALRLGAVSVGAVGLGAAAGPVRGQGAGLTVSETVADNLTPTDLANELLPDDGAIDLIDGSVEYTGDSEAAGTFSGQIQAVADGDGQDAFGFDEGIVLGTGAVTNIEGPNEGPDTTTEFGTAGDGDLDGLTTGDTTDAATLTFEFDVPDGAQTISFRYLFGSEEYNKYVFSPFNDVFGFFLNGANVATVEGAPTAINNINHGFDGEVDESDNDADAAPPVNPTLYVNNDPENGTNVHGSVDPEDPPGLGIGFAPETDPAPYDTEMDGFSVELAIDASVDPAENPQEIKLAVADVDDAQLDTWVLIEGASIEVEEQEDDGQDEQEDDGQDEQEDDGQDEQEDDGLGPSSFEVIEITDQTPREVGLSESFRVQYRVENVGIATGREPVRLEIDGQQVGNKPDTLTPGQRVLNSFTDVTLPESVNAGDTVTVTVRTDDDFETIAVTVREAGPSEYTNDDGVVDNAGVVEAIQDWQAGRIDNAQITEIINAWRTSTVL